MMGEPTSQGDLFSAGEPAENRERQATTQQGLEQAQKDVDDLRAERDKARGAHRAELDERLARWTAALSDLVVVEEATQAQDLDTPVGPKSGQYVGAVLEIQGDVMLQRTGRGGETVKHLLSALTAPVVVGEVVDIVYCEAVGVVKSRDLGLSR